MPLSEVEMIFHYESKKHQLKRTRPELTEGQSSLLAAEFTHTLAGWSSRQHDARQATSNLPRELLARLAAQGIEPNPILNGVYADMFLKNELTDAVLGDVISVRAEASDPDARSAFLAQGLQVCANISAAQRGTLGNPEPHTQGRLKGMPLVLALLAIVLAIIWYAASFGQRP